MVVTEIEALLAAYGQGMDLRDAALLRSLFAPRATFRFAGAPAFEADPGDFVDLSLHLLGPLRSLHQISNARIEVDGAAARGTFSFTAWHLDAASRCEWILHGLYREGFALTPAGWRIVHHEVEELYDTGDRGVLGLDQPATRELFRRFRGAGRAD